MAIEDIGKNALQVLEKRYLAKDAEGNHTEDVAGPVSYTHLAVYKRQVW